MLTTQPNTFYLQRVSFLVVLWAFAACALSNWRKCFLNLQVFFLSKCRKCFLNLQVFFLSKCRKCFLNLQVFFCQNAESVFLICRCFFCQNDESVFLICRCFFCQNAESVFLICRCFFSICSAFLFWLWALAAHVLSNWGSCFLNLHVFSEVAVRWALSATVVWFF